MTETEIIQHIQVVIQDSSEATKQRIVTAINTLVVPEIVAYYDWDWRHSDIQPLTTIVNQLLYDLDTNFDGMISVKDVTNEKLLGFYRFPEFDLRIVDETLKEFGSDAKTEIKVFNKVDFVEDKSRIEYILNTYEDSVIISAKKGINISKLMEMLQHTLKSSYVDEEVTIPIDETKLASQIHTLAEVYSTTYLDDVIKLKYRTNKENEDRINKLVQDTRKNKNTINGNLRIS